MYTQHNIISLFSFLNISFDDKSFKLLVLAQRVFMGGHVNCWNIMINGFLARKLVPASAGCSQGGVRKRQRRGGGCGGAHNIHSLLFTFALTISLTVLYTTCRTLPVLRAIHRWFVV
jgi:hypothetical protein